MKTPSVLVLLCTYNERNNLPEVLTALWQTLPAADVLVIDDNSPDGTGEWAMARKASEPRLHVVVRSGKLGLGSALRDGIAWTLAHRYEFLINLDADQSHDPTVAGKLLECCLNAGDSTVVAIGSRYVHGGSTVGLSLPRRWMSQLLNRYVNIVLRLPLRDCSGSYRCYPTSLLARVDLSQLTCNGYGFLEELLVHLHRCGARFCEVPITYRTRGSGSSKLSLNDALGVFQVVHRLALSKHNRPTA